MASFITITACCVGGTPLAVAATSSPQPRLALSPRATTPAPGATAPEPVPKGEVTLAFGGDVHFENQVRKQQGSGGLRTLTSLFRDPDISMVNLETSLSSDGVARKKEFTFHASPKVLKTLRKRGVDVVTMSNNHVFDYGNTGVRQTLRAKASKVLPIVGIGNNLSEALTPWVKTTKGTSFAVFGAMDQEPLSDERNSRELTRAWAAGSHKSGTVMLPQHRRQLLATLREWSKQVDVVVIYMHWGIEGTFCPSRTQRRLAADFEKAGVDLIVGAHPHRLQGAGFSGKMAIAYSMGNFVWYNTHGNDSAVLKVKVKAGRVATVGSRRVVVGSDGMPRQRMSDKLQACAHLTDRPTG